MVHFLFKLLLKHIIPVVYHDLHRLLDAKKMLTAKLH